MDNKLRVIRNEDYGLKDLGDTKKKGFYSRNLLLFIILSLMIFGGIFFIKDKVDKYKDIEEDFYFQKQQILEERIVMEKTLKEERESINALKNEYEEKLKELNEKSSLVSTKEKELDLEIKKFSELNEVLKEGLVKLYDINIDNIYKHKEDEGAKSDSLLTDDNGSSSSAPILGKEDEASPVSKEKILSVVDADWFIKFDSLGEFTY